MQNYDHSILIIEPDSILRGNLSDMVRDEGYSVSDHDGSALEAALLQQQADIVVMNAEIRKMDESLHLTRRLRDQSNMGIVLMHGAPDPVHRRMALEAGADDMLCRPPEPGELAARLKNISWRLRPAAQTQHSGTKLAFGSWIFDRATRILAGQNGYRERLTGGEARILEALLIRAGQLTCREILTRALNGRDAAPRDRTVDVLVGRLRRKLHDDPRSPAIITTVHGGGYVLTAEARPVA